MLVHCVSTTTSKLKLIFYLLLPSMFGLGKTGEQSSQCLEFVNENVTEVYNSSNVICTTKATTEPMYDRQETNINKTITLGVAGFRSYSRYSEFAIEAAGSAVNMAVDNFLAKENLAGYTIR